ncbi:MAG: GDSL-type esterase/lipase family protein [Phycisphaerae bacterium]|nr:GDSL-type esterase/lipase family protein [Phycisphaerae bacterium]
MLTSDDLIRAGMTIPDVRFGDEIEAFAQADQASPPQPDGVLFVGDSDIRFWTPLDDYFPNLPVLNRGFGGARSWEVLLYFDRVVLPPRPRVIVFCAGDNDIARLQQAGAASAVAGFRLFLELVRTHLPRTRRVLYLGIHPSPSDQPLWPVIAAANAELRPLCETSAGLAEFVDFAHLLCDELGQPRTGFFRPDGLHFTAAFYRILAESLRPRIDAAMRCGE